ncbi:MAG TPA: sugar transferase [Roseiflexaceae bacterium]|nr:sugar transferase [Roseiflexaceae bacterium]HMP40690.1 sugar transferase [Roseiflexaceae bacterium]
MSTFEGSITSAKPRETRRHERRLMRAGLILSDACVILLSFTLAHVIRFQFGLPIFDAGTFDPDFYALVIVGILPAYLLLFWLYGLYQPTNLLGGTTEYERLFNAATAGVVVLIVLTFIQPEFIVARGWLLLAWGLMVLLGMISRFMIRRFIYSQRQAGRFLSRTLIVGANPEGIAVAQQLVEAPTSGLHVIGFIDDYLSVGAEPIPGIPVIGHTNAFTSTVDLQQVETVVIANTAMMRERLLAVYSTLDALQNVEVRLASGLFELLTTGVRVREEGFVPLLILDKTRITGLHRVAKAMLDYTLAGCALLALMPFFIVLGILIKRDSPGPVIYRRRVIGQGRREFDAFKFRTMHLEGDRLLSEAERHELEQHGKLKDDPRITKIGAFLRHYSLDELPQLLNVLLGDMSLIGPRMITRSELEKFGKWQHNLSTVKPGLTGLWQVSGRSDLSYEDRVRLDMHYIRNYTIWLDIQILFRTIPALLTGRGAY